MSRHNELAYIENYNQYDAAMSKRAGLSYRRREYRGSSESTDQLLILDHHRPNNPSVSPFNKKVTGR